MLFVKALFGRCYKASGITPFLWHLSYGVRALARIRNAGAESHANSLAELDVQTHAEGWSSAVHGKLRYRLDPANGLCPCQALSST